jgi:hypothetical protein
MKNDYPTKEVFICDCFSNEHQLVLCYMFGDDELDFDTMTFQFYLNPTFGFWKRIGVAIRYIFGYKSKYGDWDDYMVNHKDCDKLIDYFQKLKNDYVNVNANITNSLNNDSVLDHFRSDITNTKPQNTTTNNP